QTNQAISSEKSKALLVQASKKLANELGKPERYVMVELTSNPSMLFGGTDEPAAYLELKSIGLPTGQTKNLSKSLSSLLEEDLGIASSRIYIEFTDVKGNLWGWNGSTF
ncbi:MAG: phenylpyruvate tautomerase MIF-related protein, partial [Candidatus Methylumidiphilus sp.]